MTHSLLDLTTAQSFIRVFCHWFDDTEPADLGIQAITIEK